MTKQWATEALIAVGSNLGDRRQNIFAALRQISQDCGTVSRTAALYETLPIGNANRLFLNTALVCESWLEPADLMQHLLAIESRLGRRRSNHHGNRCIDLDIILLRDSSGRGLTFNAAQLMVPHPRALERDFVMIPAAEIAGDWVHPLTQKTLREEVINRGYKLMAAKNKLACHGLTDDPPRPERQGRIAWRHHQSPFTTPN